MIIDSIVEPMELAHLATRRAEIMSAEPDSTPRQEKWQRDVAASWHLSRPWADDTVLGGVGSTRCRAFSGR
jgi:hypothetical protein